MTHNQIDYASLVETKRHNQEVELNARNVTAETVRHNTAVESIQREANIINQNHYAAMDAESARHNSSVEAETNRHNLAMESISRRQNEIAAQQNRIRMKEVQEKMWMDQQTVNINQQNADTAAQNAQTNRLNWMSTSSVNESATRVNNAKIADYASQKSYREAQAYTEGVKAGSNIINDAVSNVVRIISGGRRTRISGAVM